METFGVHKFRLWFGLILTHSKLVMRRVLFHLMMMMMMRGALRELFFLFNIIKIQKKNQKPAQAWLSKVRLLKFWWQLDLFSSSSSSFRFWYRNISVYGFIFIRRLNECLNLKRMKTFFHRFFSSFLSQAKLQHFWIGYKF